MDQNLKTILDFIQHNENLSTEEKALLVGLVSNVDKELSITTFKLDRTEKVKRTTAILLEETIEELEQKRKAVEKQNRELEIESSLERVRTVAMGMRKKDDMLEVCSIISQQSEILGIKEIRNVQTAIIYEEKGTYLNYEYYAKHDKHLVTEVEYKNHKLQSMFANRMLQGAEELFYESMNGKEVQEWYEYQKTTNQFADSFLENAQSLNYYFYSLGPVALGISSYTPLSDEEINLFKRFRNVFDMAYRRFLDIEKAEFQARESQIELALERVRARTMAMVHSNELAETVAVMFEQFKALGEEPERMAIEIVNEKKHVFDIWATQHGGSQLSELVQISLDEPHVMKKMYKAWKEKTKSITIDLQGNELEEYFQFLKKSKLPVQRKIFGKRRVQNVATFSKGILTIITPEPRPQETIQLLERFAAVFDGTYTRFFDLQNAEAQAREGQIEGALERVRSTSLAMYSSMDLSKVVFVVFTELVKLDALLDRCLLLIVDPKKLDITWYLTGKEGLLSNNGFLVPDNTHPSHQAYLEGWRAKRKKWQYLLGGDEKQRWDAYGFSQTGLAQLPDFIKADMSSVEAIHLTISSDNFGCLIASSLSPLSEVHAAIVDRFTSVFNQAYTRFLDLQRAEAQSREAKIEAALERVRSRTMAMRGSEELLDVASILFQQVKALGVPQWNCGFNIWEIGDDEFTYYPGTPDGIISQSPCRIPLNEHPVFMSFDESRKRGDELFIYEKEGEMQRSHYHYMLSLPGVGDVLQSMLNAGFEFPVFQIDHVVNFAYGNLIFITYEHFPEMHDVFKRFAKVFEQTYTRFLDLQKAEAQAREAKIEAAMEKIRSCSMAMQKPEELIEVAEILRREMGQLGVEELETSSIYLVNEDNQRAKCWYAIKDVREGNSKLVSDEITIVFRETWVASRMWDFYNSAEEQGSIVMTGNNRKEWINYCADRSQILQGYYGTEIPARSYHLVKFKGGYLGAAAPGEISAESWKLIKRATKVFSLAYTRFSDLKQAKVQAREAQIEAALERVRSRTMGMQKSVELKEVIKIVYQQLAHLKIKLDHAGFVVDYEPKGDWHFWIADERDIPSQITHPWFESVWANQFNEAKEKGGELFATLLNFEEKNKFYNKLLSYVPGLPEASRDFYLSCPGLAATTVLSDNVSLYIENFSGTPYTAEENNILIRFARVFEQTYTRFLDLQKAEVQAIEATKRASVDRVRAEIASMRTTKDLERITPLIWNELTTLGVPFIRSGVFIMDEAHQQVQVHLSTPAGKAIAAFQLDYEASVQSRQIVSHWREMKVFKDHMDEAAFAEYTKNLVQQGALAGDEKYVTENHPTDLYLHFLPFAQGMLYVGNDAPFKEEELQLVQNLADAFSTAYARYEDFNKLEIAKNQVDQALVDLKQAQQQLIQSEKMASLGELTAGIAHEIQNPLNFVNNFSEVSSELVDEMNEELARGNIDDAKEIASDLKQNLEKITHHGKRADAIVKGMLQHSRTSSGQKEVTDINVLADEYLRLTYHGLRAKDKSFNAKMETDFDPALPKIEIAPQDIGRVILNLITNAFYAVNEKSKQGIAGYEPTVSVSTKKVGDKVQISVKDNGNGIPEHIREKIFQPFFTTKPAGQGTGLGLSLSYDIVKAHGGELKLKTKEGEGSEFIISLPII